MTTHVAKTLRDAVVAELAAGVPSVSGRVFSGVRAPVSAREMPALQVFGSGREDVTREVAGTPAIQLRRFDLVIKPVVSESDAETVLDTLDAIAAEVETAMHAGGTFGGACRGTDYLGRDPLLDDAGQPSGLFIMRFEAQIMTMAGAPGAAI